MTIRYANEQPVIIYLLTPRGHIASPPLEWGDAKSLEHRFILSRDTYVNGYIVAHPDGAILYRSPTSFEKISKGPYTVSVTLGDTCDDPDCEVCRAQST